jgi:hypothetical protein
MRTTRALAAAGAAVAVLGLAAPAAVARDGMNLSPSNVVALPNVIARGGQLTITVNNCTGNATASSDAFRTIRLRTGANNLATGRATVNRNAATGSHSIHVVWLGGSSSAGATPTDMAIGGGLVALAVIGGGVFWMRRRSEKPV